MRLTDLILIVFALIVVIKHTVVAVLSYKKKDYSRMKVSLLFALIAILVLGFIFLMMWLIKTIF